MAVIVSGRDIALIGTVSGGAVPWLFEEERFGHAEVMTALAEVGRDADITVCVNSGGGIASEGAAIHAAFAAHKGKVAFRVEGWAASAASLFIMAGKVTMAPGSLLMVHDPANGCWGTAADHAKCAAMLDTQANTYAQVYADKTGKTADEMRAVMKEEVWYGPAEAVAAGFADAADSSNDNEVVEPAAFGAVTAYAHAPERIVAMAQAKGWMNARTTMHMHTAPPASSAPASGGGMDPLVLMEACQAAGFPQLASGLMKAGADSEAVMVRLNEAAAIAQMCDMARVPSLKAALVNGGISLDAARIVAAEFRVAQDESTFIDTALPSPGQQMAAIDHRAVYQSINNRRG